MKTKTDVTVQYVVATGNFSGGREQNMQEKMACMSHLNRSLNNHQL
jgi:hypothetical protein